MKKWIVIGLSATTIMVWIAFFFILIGKDVPSLTAKHHTESIREEFALSKEMKRFELNEINTPNESLDSIVIESDKSKVRSDDILYEFEYDNAVSIDELLAALKIGTE